ncbi:hypothetical protein SAMN06297251_12323 [Fulvimarina manganoxydans]|uniref:Uncharacterized protein n=1 Tax=Fulvimarina manganoxydans TaxID=937218 RepID=A0A1W2EA75_9HYPH|nr:hypothetical protein [Fulvimarina manganoxydans]SMD06654.1 hypothetical protein SAMN06297251_12323 [Fulvimarina manganoxydans]
MDVDQNLNITFVETKLVRLKGRINELLEESLPYSDSKSAAETLLARVDRQIARARDSHGFSPALREQVGLQALLLLQRVTHILGILSRSSVTRNALELYEPFRIICTKFFKIDVSIILSSEWNFIPFTYPMVLDDLPNCIIIGLPASESDNILIFPAAAHELGHTLWLHNQLGSVYAQRIRIEAEAIVTADANAVSASFPVLPDNDLFRKAASEQLVSEVAHFAMKQIEEMFCDYIGLFMFGRSYLLAFEYLIAPGLKDRTVGTYPTTYDRAKMLNEEAANHDCSIVDYENHFVRKQNINPINEFKYKAADRLRNQFIPDIIRTAHDIISDAGISIPNSEKVEAAKKFFAVGMPVSNGFSIGEMVSAAWALFNDMEFTPLTGSMHDKTNHLSDLVFKSVEVQEFQGWRKDA